jgi:DNA-binding NtrC family response regulator
MKVKVSKSVDSNGHAQKRTAPVNIRLRNLTELTATIQREVDALRFELLTHSLLLKDTFDIGTGIDLPREVRRFEIELITSALRRTGGHQAKAARMLGLKITTLNAKIKNFDISPLDMKMQHINQSRHA